MTTISTLAEWFERGEKEKATHMIVVCDTYDHEDYPVYVKQGEDARIKAQQYSGQNMQTVMEVYNLSMGIEKQFQPGKRVFNY